MNKQMVKGLPLLAALTILVAACSGQQPSASDGGAAKGDQPAAGTQQAPTPAVIDNKPVTVTINTMHAMSDEDFDKLFVQPVKKKYPHITLKLIKLGNIPEMVTTGSIPDLFISWNGGTGTLSILDIPDDATPYLQKQKIDLSRFDPVVMDALRVMSSKNELYGLPFKTNYTVLYYNKDVFDKFGVAYPKDGLFWEDAIEIAKKLSRVQDGVTYRGLDPERIYRLSFPYSLNYVDPKTDKASINNDQWKKVFEMAKAIYSIPNNNPTKSKGFGNAADAFLKDKTVGMLGTTNLNSRLQEVYKDLNWDMVQYPSYKDKPNVFGMVDAQYLILSKTSKNKDAAIQVMEAVTSDEAQMVNVRQLGNLAPLKDKKFADSYGKDMAMLQGKNLPAIFKSKFAPAAQVSIYTDKAITVVNNRFEDYLKGTKDLNTVMRESEEQINKMVETEKVKK
jgi:ABC-type glycerol-3-phosphate transport system substrate-binding protein